MSKVYIILVIGVVLIALDFTNSTTELLMSSIGGGHVGWAVRKARDLGREEGFKSGRGY